MLSDFKLYNIHDKGAEIERLSIMSTKVDYIELNRKVVPTNRVKFNPTEGRCLKRY